MSDTSKNQENPKESPNTDRQIRDLWENLRKQMIEAEQNTGTRMGTKTKKQVRELIEELKKKKDLDVTNMSLSDLVNATNSQNKTSKIDIKEDEKAKLKKMQKMQ